MVKHRLKIVLISRGWWNIVFGGAERFIHGLAKELSLLGYDIIGLTRLISNKEAPKTPYKLLWFMDNKNIPIFSNFKFALWAASVTNKIKPNVVLVNSYWGEITPLFISRDIPVIAIIHDVGLFRSEWARRHKFKHFLRVQVLKMIIRKAKLIIVPTKVVKKDVVRFLKANPFKIVVLGFEGVDGPFERVHEINEFFDLVQVGRFAPNKGHLTTLYAFREVIKKIPNARLWLIGGKSLDPEHILYFKKVRYLANRINKDVGKEVVKIIVDAPSVDPYYRLADVCIAPSVSEEGFGLVVIECMAYGKPVIASDIFVETGVASPERCLIFKRGNYRELAESIMKLYKDKYLYHKLSVEGLKYSKKHSWRELAKIFAKIIEDTIPTQ